MAVRLFIGNLPYGATEADLRAHFAPVAAPSHVVMPVDRETGRPRGFAFVEFADRTAADEVIRKFDAQPFQGRNLAVSEARAREDRPPGPRPPGGGSVVRGPAGSAARVPVALAAAGSRRGRGAGFRTGGRDRSASPACAAQDARARRRAHREHKPWTDRGKRRRPDLRGEPEDDTSIDTTTSPPRT